MLCPIQTTGQELMDLKESYLVLIIKFYPHNLFGLTNIQQPMEGQMLKGILEDLIL